MRRRWVVNLCSFTIIMQLNYHLAIPNKELSTHSFLLVASYLLALWSLTASFSIPYMRRQRGGGWSQQQWLRHLWVVVSNCWLEAWEEQQQLVSWVFKNKAWWKGWFPTIPWGWRYSCWEVNEHLAAATFKTAHHCGHCCWWASSFCRQGARATGRAGSQAPGHGFATLTELLDYNLYISIYIQWVLRWASGK